MLAYLIRILLPEPVSMRDSRHDGHELILEAAHAISCAHLGLDIAGILAPRIYLQDTRLCMQDLAALGFSAPSDLKLCRPE